MFSEAEIVEARDGDEFFSSDIDISIEILGENTMTCRSPRHLGLSYSIQDCSQHGGPSIAVPHTWIGERSLVSAVPGIGIYALKNAYVFGGLITERPQGGTQHISGQLLLTNRFEVIPPSFGIMDGMRSLPADLPSDAGELVAKFPDGAQNLPGTYLFLGNAHIHFGHFVIEGLSRLWAIDIMERRFGNDFKILIYEDGLTDSARALLNAAGIEDARIVSSPKFGCCERIFAPDVAMKTHSWVSRLQNKTWSRIRERSASTDFPEKGAGRVYLSRSQIPGRKLSNESEVEDFFRSSDFEIVSPESLSIKDQLRYVLNADTLAGCVGSQMYLAAFQRPGGKNIILAPENFFLRDDVLISHACGHELDVVFGSLTNFGGDGSWIVDIDAVRRTLHRAN